MLPDSIKIVSLLKVQRRSIEGPPSKVCHGVARTPQGVAVFRSVKQDSKRVATPIAYFPTEQEAERLARELNNETHTPDDDY